MIAPLPPVAGAGASLVGIPLVFAAASAASASSFDPAERQRTSHSRAGLSIAGFYYLRLCRLTGAIEGLYFDPSAGSPFQKLELAPAPARVRPASACYFNTGRAEDDDADEEGGGDVVGMGEDGDQWEKTGRGAAAGEESDDDGEEEGASDDGGASAVSSFAFN